MTFYFQYQGTYCLRTLVSNQLTFFTHTFFFQHLLGTKQFVKSLTHFNCLILTTFQVNTLIIPILQSNKLKGDTFSVSKGDKASQRQEWNLSLNYHLTQHHLNLTSGATDLENLDGLSRIISLAWGEGQLHFISNAGYFTMQMFLEWLLPAQVSS